MLDKIKNLNPWIVALLIALAIELLVSLVMSVFNIHMSGFLADLGFVFSLPALKITGYESVQAINEFGGDPRDLSNFTEVAIVSGLGIFVVLILGPFLLLKGYAESEDLEGAPKRSLTWYAGAIMVMMALIPSVLSSTIGTTVYFNISESSEDSRQLDLLRGQLMNLALDASYLMFLPEEKGGAEGSFNSVGKDGEKITLNDLDSYEERSNFEFQIYEEINDSSFTIVGVSQRNGNDENFENINGETGRQQTSVEVTPYQENIFQINKDGSLKN